MTSNSHIDDDGNVTTEHLHIYRGTNTKEGIWNHPCPNCGSASYLGVFIPTVTTFKADWYSTTFQCHNEACDPIYEEDEIDWDENGDECEPRKVYDLVDCGAYWDVEDEYYYTPQSPRL
jgi:hypothetical protein